MISKKITINLEKKDDIFHLEPLSDIHVGHMGFDKELYKKRIRAITKSDNRYTLFLGDQFDAITTYDKRFNPDMSLIHDVDNQRKLWQKLSQPLINEHLSRMNEYEGEEEVWDEQLKKAVKEPKQLWRVKKGTNEKVWGLLHGNHEYNIREATRAYLENNLCDKNGLTFLGSRAVIGVDVRFNGKTLKQWIISAIHGSGGGKPEPQMEKQRKNHYMDVFISGHLHQKRYTPTGAVGFDFKTGLATKVGIHSINAGTFCEALIEGKDGYMDRKAEAEHTMTGTATLTFNAEQDKITGHV
tara:strand:+ start:914 stop:1807 length:894 start_codon:yes stop_codon:yes gene_type:complete